MKQLNVSFTEQTDHEYTKLILYLNINDLALLSENDTLCFNYQWNTILRILVEFFSYRYENNFVNEFRIESRKR